MAVTFMQQESAGAFLEPNEAGAIAVCALTDAHEAEALAFLAARPVHTVFMATLIRDNGLISPLNRGTFYGCRDARGRLTGLALIGHATIIETADDAALAVFARLAQNCPTAYLIRGEQERVARFWQHYESRGRRPRRMCRELLLEQRPPVAVLEAVRGLRPATCEDLRLIIEVNARMIADECGVNPL